MALRRGELRGQWADSYTHANGLTGLTTEAGQGHGPKRVEGEEFAGGAEPIGRVEAKIQQRLGLGRPEASRGRDGGHNLLITNPPHGMGGGDGAIGMGNGDLEARIPPAPGLRKDI